MNKVLFLPIITLIISLLSSSSGWSGFKSIRDLQIDCEKERPICKSYIDQTIKGLVTGRSWTEHKGSLNNTRWCLPSTLILEDYKKDLINWLKSNREIDSNQNSKWLMEKILEKAFPCPETHTALNREIEHFNDQSQQPKCLKNCFRKQ